MIKGTEIKLSTEDQEAVIDFVKRLKADFKEGKKRGLKVDDSRTRDQTTISGTGAEVGYCRLIGAKPDLTIHQKTSYVDLVYQGQNIDVKQTEHEFGRLIIDDNYPYDTNVDICVLMIGNFPTYEYRGWAFKDEIYLPENREYLGKMIQGRKSMPYCLKQQFLHGYQIPQKEQLNNTSHREKSGDY